MCKEHGAGATKKWKPTSTIVVGKDGERTIKKGGKNSLFVILT